MKRNGHQDRLSSIVKSAISNDLATYHYSYYNDEISSELNSIWKSYCIYCFKVATLDSPLALGRPVCRSQALSDKRSGLKNILCGETNQRYLRYWISIRKTAF